MNSQRTGAGAPRQEHTGEMLHAKQPAPAPALVAHRVERRQAASRERWKTQVGAMKAAFVELESICSGIIAQTLESDVEAAAIIEQTNRRIAEVTSAADTAILRARVQADVESAELRQVIQRLGRELEAERNRASAAQLNADETATLKAELIAARNERDELVRQLEAERAKQTGVIAAACAVERALTVPLPVQWHDADAEICAPVGEIDAESSTAVEDARDPVRTTESTGPAEEGGARVSAATHGLHFDVCDYARQLLEEIEAIYDADEASGMPPSELVGRLVANLAYATDVFDRRAGYSAHGEGSIFQQQVEIALDAKADRSFGRHLAVAVHEYEQQRKQTGDARVA